VRQGSVSLLTAPIPSAPLISKEKLSGFYHH
jgi:hypothetical protein